MKTIKSQLKTDLSTYPYEKLGNLQDDLLFVDIETTGLNSSRDSVYMIGCAYCLKNSFYSIQWIAESDSDEEQVIYSFFNFAKKYRKLIHFNGNRFDIPFLQDRISILGLPYDMRSFEGLDLYKRLRPYKSFLKLSSMKQSALEEFLGIDRGDDLPGGELISVYKEYTQTHDSALEEELLHHNYHDLRGMVCIVPLLSVPDMFNEKIRVIKAGKNPYTDSQGVKKSEVIMELSLPSPLPVQISYGFSDCYFTGEGTRGKLRVAIYEGEAKFFYPNYKEYYYIPDEDIAVHKSVATYVDSSRRESAKASNCYTRKAGIFLPMFSPIFAPEYKLSYADKTGYVELDDAFKRDPKKFTRYAEHLLQTLVTA